MTLKNAITDVRGIEVGQAQDEEGLTGCTVLLCRQGAVAGVDVRGSAPGTRETDLLDPVNLVEKVHAVVLTGGSAYGLDAAGGVMRYLEEQNIGYGMGSIKVPIVPAVVLYDLGLGRADIRPDAAMGYRAATSASSAAPVEGNVGAGMGASIGKVRGMEYAMKAGIGTASMDIHGLIIGAIVAVNAIGDVVDPGSGGKIAGLRSGTTLDWMKNSQAQSAVQSNTVIGAIATNARLTKAQATRMAAMADDGLARALYPSHTLGDGDTVFALATGSWTGTADVSVVGSLAADAMSEAIVRAAVMARRSASIPAAVDLGTIPARFK